MTSGLILIRCLALASALAAPIAAHADVAASVAACRAEADSLKRLTCYDKLELPTLPSSPPAAATAGRTPVTMTVPNVRQDVKDYERQIYNPRIVFNPTFRNASAKTVVGIVHEFSFTSAFGEVLLKGEDQLDIRLAPKTAGQAPTFYYWDDNPFIAGEPYDRLVGPVVNDTLKATSVVKRVVYSDGTSEAY